MCLCEEKRRSVVVVLTSKGVRYFGEGSHISTNQERENGAFLHLIGQNMKPFPENTLLYNLHSYSFVIKFMIRN